MNQPRSHRPAPLRLLLLTLAFELLAASHLPAVTFPLRWHWSNPTPHGNNIIDMAYHNGVYVEVAERGQVLSSEDLALWIPRDTHVTNTLQAVGYFQDRLIVTGENGLVLYADSLDAIQSVDLGTTDWLEGVAASTNLLVAVGDNAAIYTSVDGATWQRRPQPFSTWLRSVTYGAGVFVTVGEGGFIATSADGVSWVPRTSRTTNDLNKVVWTTNAFWVAGDGGTVLLGLNNGTTWQSLSSGATNVLYTTAGYAGSTLVAGNVEVRLRSNLVWSDQLDPSQSPSPAPRWTYFSSLWDGSAYLLGGRSGMLVQGVQTNATAAWQTPTSPIRNWLWDVTRTPGLYVAVGDHANIMTSDNGLDWELELVPDAVTNSIFLGVGGTTNLLVAAGSSGSLVYSPNAQRTVVTTNADGSTTTNTGSAFGVVWYAVTPNPAPNDDLQGVGTLGNLIVVTGGSGAILTSADGTNWTRRTALTTNFLSSVTDFPGGLVAVGDRGTILLSPDGASWTAHPFGTTNWVYRVRYLGGQLIAVGQNGLILVGTDGVSWTPQASGTSRWLNDVAYLDNTYFVVGNQGTVLTSPNAAAWTNLGTITEKSLYGLAVNGGQLIAVGTEGTILRSQIIPQLTPVNILKFSRTSGQNLFLFSGQADQRFTLDASTTLTNWITGPLLEFYDSSGTLLYLPDTNAAPMEFYRTTLTP